MARIELKRLSDHSKSDKNVFHDKLRAIRWDDQLNQWLLSTSEGFYLLDDLKDGKPKAIAPDKAPVVSPMGVNVICLDGKDWLIGSFSGLFRWNIGAGSVTDYFTGEVFSVLYVFIAGLLLTLILLSGYIVNKRTKK